MDESNAGQAPPMTGESGGSSARPRRRGLLAPLGAIGTAALASLCCIGPVIFVTLGVGAGLASRFEPLRPLFTLLTLVLLAIGFAVVYRRRFTPADDVACAPGTSCAAPRSATRDKIILWTAAIVALLLLTFPQWSKLLV